MSTEWTTERLETLPVWTVIDYQLAGSVDPDIDTAVKIQDGSCLWQGAHSGDVMSSEDVLLAGVPRTIRVVSVPVDALLEAGPINDAASVLNGPIPLPHGIAASFALRAAIAHATGEADS